MRRSERCQTIHVDIKALPITEAILKPRVPVLPDYSHRVVGLGGRSKAFLRVAAKPALLSTLGVADGPAAEALPTTWSVSDQHVATISQATHSGRS